jgi:hypothetical protein
MDGVPLTLASYEASADTDPTNARRAFTGWRIRITGAASGALGTVAGITPHVLHHVGPIAGTALLTGTGGSFLFGAAGFVLTTPLLLQLRRRFRTWIAPAIALTVFATMFTVSTLWIGPAVRDLISGDDGVSDTSHEEHHAMHLGLEDLEV